MFRRLMLTAATVIALSPVAGSVARADAGVYKQTLPSVAWVLTEKPDAKKPGMYEGTAWVVDRENRLLVTNHHVVDGAERVKVYFPQRRNGKLMTDREWYVRSGRGFRAKVVVADARRDLAVIRIDAMPEDVRELKLADGSPEVGDEVFTVGNPGLEDDLWVGNRSTVRSVKQETILTREGNRFEGTRQESKLAISPGASGSPVVNAAGEVIGVVFAGDFPKAGEPAARTFSVDVTEVRAVLAKARTAGPEEKPNERADGRPEGDSRKSRMVPNFK